MAEKNPETWPAGREGSESVKFALRKTAAYCITPFFMNMQEVSSPTAILSHAIRN
ncbi:hypothetical protein [Pantoea sp. 1B4]|uniref:hypothetical protein n=1 Tax=Pantoea sp. 1B4 TaxID=2804760 RepID=UPI002D8007B1|nr:hypothetical protein [Pantoea sp. 1B4]